MYSVYTDGQADGHTDVACLTRLVILINKVTRINIS